MRRAKTWPGFASVVRDSKYSQNDIMKWWGLSEDVLLSWYSNGAPVYAHIAIRATNDLGFSDHHFFGWSLDSGWLIAPNGRKISIRRLETIAKVQQEHSIRLVKQ